MCQFVVEKIKKYTVTAILEKEVQRIFQSACSGPLEALTVNGSVD